MQSQLDRKTTVLFSFGTSSLDLDQGKKFTPSSVISSRPLIFVDFSVPSHFQIVFFGIFRHIFFYYYIKKSLNWVASIMLRRWVPLCGYKQPLLRSWRRMRIEKWARSLNSWKLRREYAETEREQDWVGYRGKNMRSADEQKATHLWQKSAGGPQLAQEVWRSCESAKVKERLPPKMLALWRRFMGASIGAHSSSG